MLFCFLVGLCHVLCFLFFLFACLFSRLAFLLSLFTWDKFENMGKFANVDNYWKKSLTRFASTLNIDLTKLDSIQHHIAHMKNVVSIKRKFIKK